MQQYTQNYIRAGGKRDVLASTTSPRTTARSFAASLAENVVFAQHNLATDGAFNEFNVIVCRNVMIYFDRTLQDRVHELFYESLETFGILALGHKESLALHAVRANATRSSTRPSASTGRSLGDACTSSS